MRLLLVNANTTAAITEACAAAARQVAAPGTEILSATARFGPAVIANRAENAIAAHAVLDLLAERAEACDAVLLAVSFDTGLAAARELLRVPVVGMTGAACLFACALGGRFGLISFSTAAMYRELIEGYGLGTRLAGIALIDATPAEVSAEPERVAAKVSDAARRLAESGAESAILAGAAFAALGRRLADDAPIPLVDGIAAGVKLAEALVALGLARPTAAAPAVPRPSLGLSPPLAALLARTPAGR
ncbi:aspartate/glutamate racemase family protein [Elioraea thermophila]|uniref:aspartate/glutamate racemase family protein n=1 Tax=Elioraea thermophila TaxID=2185104 RepID=UPI000DF3666B|nr:aspartate/glutamate racemase family protein [Elioraea thermophila]